MIATAVMTLNGHEGHSPLADFFKCNPSNICAAFYTISTDRRTDGRTDRQNYDSQDRPRICSHSKN